MDKYHEQCLESARKALGYYQQANEILANEIERISGKIEELEQDVQIIEGNVDILANKDAGN